MFNQAARQFARNAIRRQARTITTDAKAEPLLKFEEKWPEYAALMSKEEIVAANARFDAGLPYIFGKGTNLKPLFQDTSMKNYSFFSKPLELKPGELGNGNLAQRNFNESMWELQQADPLNRAYGAMGIDRLNNEWFGTNNLMAVVPAVTCAWVAANLYREMYLEKYNLWDMAIWETRVISKEAKEAREAARAARNQ